jgi:glycine/D-amino acid oxidase-like deaminating enzyme
MTRGDIFTADWSTEPLWWQDAPPDAGDDRPLPERIEVAVIGSGYCGLAAALELARAGMGVAVLDAGPLGHGASSRNGGMVGGAVKLDWSDLARRYGELQAAAIHDGARASFEHLESLIARAGLDADYQRCGRFLLACNRAQFRALQRELDALGERASTVQVVPRERQREQIGSDFYHGGVVIEESGGLHPTKLHRALRATVQAAGAELHADAEVQHLEPSAAGMTLVTARGRMRADQVVLATNGYTGSLLPDLRRRFVPVSLAASRCSGPVVERVRRVCVTLHRLRT